MCVCIIANVYCSWWWNTLFVNMMKNICNPREYFTEFNTLLQFYTDILFSLNVFYYRSSHRKSLSPVTTYIISFTRSLSTNFPQLCICYKMVYGICIISIWGSSWEVKNIVNILCISMTIPQHLTICEFQCKIEHHYIHESTVQRPLHCRRWKFKFMTSIEDEKKLR